MTGAEFAPSIVVGYVTERGGFYATLDAVPMITRHNNERVKAPYVEAVRQLSCDEPDDMRAIWRLAALALGESDVRARSAVMVRDQRGLHLVIAEAHGRTGLWTAPSDQAWSIGNSTAALCAHVWGPK